VQQGSLSAPLFVFLLLLLTLAAAAADQFVAPVLYTSSPLWALAVCAALVWRKGLAADASGLNVGSLEFSPLRVAGFAAAHVVLIALALRVSFAPPVSVPSTGWLLAALKLLVVAPALLLLPLKSCVRLLRSYSAEFFAGVIVLLTFFPVRILNAIWPLYVQALGKVVFWISGIFVSGLSYSATLNPTIAGPNLDLTIIPACSGLSGIELFDCLFALIAVLDWNRLNKRRTAVAYFAGVAAMLIGNALRIASLIVLGNHGFATSVARFHLSAGWLFFAVVFLVYLGFTYRHLLVRPTAQTA
jgi:exosortase/archaeosortase family protein